MVFNGVQFVKIALKSLGLWTILDGDSSPWLSFWDVRRLNGHVNFMRECDRRIPLSVDIVKVVVKKKKNVHDFSVKLSCLLRKIFVGIGFWTWLKNEERNGVSVHLAWETTCFCLQRLCDNRVDKWQRQSQ